MVKVDRGGLVRCIFHAVVHDANAVSAENEEKNAISVFFISKSEVDISTLVCS